MATWKNTQACQPLPSLPPCWPQGSASMRDKGAWGGSLHPLWTGALTPKNGAEHSRALPVQHPLCLGASEEATTEGVWGGCGWLHTGHGGCHHCLIVGKCFSFSSGESPGLLGKNVRPYGTFWGSEFLGWGPGRGRPACGWHSWLGTDLHTGLHPFPNHPSSLQPVMNLLVHSFGNSSI